MYALMLKSIITIWKNRGNCPQMEKVEIKIQLENCTQVKYVGVEKNTILADAVYNNVSIKCLT